MECCATEGRSSYTLIWKALQVILFKKKNKRGLWNNSGALGLGGDLLAKLLALDTAQTSCPGPRDPVASRSGGSKS